MIYKRISDVQCCIGNQPLIVNDESIIISNNECRLIDIHNTEMYLKLWNTAIFSTKGYEHIDNITFSSQSNIIIHSHTNNIYSEFDLAIEVIAEDSINPFESIILHAKAKELLVSSYQNGCIYNSNFDNIDLGKLAYKTNQIHIFDI